MKWLGTSVPFFVLHLFMRMFIAASWNFPENILLAVPVPLDSQKWYNKWFKSNESGQWQV